MMNDSRITARIARRSDVEVLTEDGKKMFERRLEADVARREGDAPLFSAKGQAITPEMEAEYMAAAEAGDLATAQRMVDEAAQAAGYTIGPVYHAGEKSFNEFKTLAEQAEETGEYYEPEGYDGGNLGIGFYFTPDLAYAAKYGKARKFYLKIEKLLDTKNTKVQKRFSQLLDEMNEDLGDVAQGEVIDALLDETNSTGVVGYGVGGFSNGSTEYMVRRSKQAKLADPVAYDNNNNIIPLSQRFNEQVDDIRFSVKGQAITPEMEAEYMAAVESGDMNTAQQMVNKAMDIAGIVMPTVVQRQTNYAADVTVQNNRAYSPIVRDLLRRRAEGENITQAMINEAIVNNFPSSLVKVPNTVADLPSEAEVINALDERQKVQRIEKQSIPINSQVTLRQDVPSWTRNKVGVVTIQTKNGKAYSQAARILNPDFVVNEKESLKIAMGESKKPHIAIRGTWSPDQSMPFNLKKWTQVGYNPDRHSFYYDRATMIEVVGGSEAYQIGNTVFVKDAKYINDPVLYDAQGNVIPLSQRFQDTIDDIRYSVRAKVPAAVGFAGGGTFEIALSDVLDTQLAVEMKPDIAEAYNRNAQRPATVAKIGDVDAEDFKGKVLAHFSPPCVDSSLLRSGQGVNKAEETERGREVANIIRVAQNPIVVIENVREYGKSEAYKLITDALTESGYTWDAHVYKAQDYGSPSKRQRLFVRAVKEGELPPRPEPTHSNKPTLFEAPYASWGDAIADLLPTLPEFEGPLPPYVLKSLAAQSINPKSPSKAYYISGTQVHGLAPLSPFDKPSPGMVASGAETPRILMPDGRVLRVTPEAMKRLMGFGAEMQLPSDPKLAKRIVGNGIPKPLTRAVVLPLLESQGVLDTQSPLFSVKGKGGEKPGKPAKQKPATRVSATEVKRAAAELKKAQARAERSRLKTLRESMRRVEGLAAIAEKGGEGTDIGEAPGTAIAGATEEGRAYTRALREDMADIRDQILPDLKADDEARAEAVAKLDADYEGTKRQLYEEITETGNVSEPWKVYATMVIAAREAEAATTGRMTVDKYLAAYEAEAYDAIVKRAASAGLRVRKDSVMSARKRNKAHLFAETSSLRREMRKLRKAIDTGNKKQRDSAEKKIAKMRQQHAEAVVEFFDSMQQQGYDIDDMYSYLAKGDVVSFSRLARGAADARVRTDLASGRVQSAWDGLMEIRLASMLSGMGTHVANITGNAAMQTLRTTRQLAEVLTNMVYRDPNSADYGDFKAYMTGWLRSLSRATRNFVMAYRTDMPVFEVELSAEAASEFANQTNAIPGIIGRILRFPSLTTLRAFDEFFKTMAAYTETASLAYRDGRSKGISGPALENYIDGVLVNYNDPLWQEGLDRALETVFQGKGDSLTRILLSTREYLNNNPTTVPIGTYLLPFIKTPLQIFKVGLSMPIHPVIPLMRWINTLRGIEYTKAQQVTDSANALISAGMMMLAYGLLGDDDDDEVAATGAAPDEYTERELMARVAPAYSIKGPGGDWYSYARIEPFATAFSAMVDLSRAQQRLMRDDVPDKWSQSFGIVLNNALGQIEDKTFLRTVGDVAKMVRDREQINVARFTKDLFVTPMIPNLVRQQVGASDPYVRNTSVREYEDVSAWEAAMQVVSFQVYPDANRPDAPPIKYDLWGRSIEKPGRSEFARNFSPAKLEYQEEDIHKLDRLIVTFNDKVEDGKFGGDVQKYLPRAVEYRIKRNDKEYLLTKEEYARVSKEAGEKAAQRLQYRRLNYDDPTERDIEVIKEQISKSRKLIIDKVLRERRLTQNQTPQNP
jgi:site-specific DNA-cytosine methylase